MTQEIFNNSPLDEEEQWYEDNCESFVSTENQAEMRLAAIEAAGRNIASRSEQKRISINLDSGTIDYFKKLSAETGVYYQSLINMFLNQCAREKKRPVFA